MIRVTGTPGTTELYLKEITGNVTNQLICSNDNLFGCESSFSSVLQNINERLVHN